MDKTKKIAKVNVFSDVFSFVAHVTVDGMHPHLYGYSSQNSAIRGAKKFCKKIGYEMTLKKKSKTSKLTSTKRKANKKSCSFCGECKDSLIINEDFSGWTGDKILICKDCLKNKKGTVR